jgi:hypothetical protein
MPRIGCNSLRKREFGLFTGGMEVTCARADFGGSEAILGPPCGFRGYLRNLAGRDLV